MKLASFALSLRAHSLEEDLMKQGITCQIVTPKWTNKKLPPPRTEVHIADRDLPYATEVLKAFNAPEQPRY